VVSEPYNDSYEVNGEKRYQIRFRVTRWVRLGGRKGEASGDPAPSTSGVGSDQDGDIPF
jgi:hypothetical protein